jgi:hypothetical protein
MNADSSLLGCYVVRSCRWLPKFQTEVSPPIVGYNLQDHMASQHRRLLLAYSPPSEPQISELT